MAYSKEDYEDLEKKMVEKLKTTREAKLAEAKKSKNSEDIEKYTQGGMATALGMEQADYSRIERGAAKKIPMHILFAALSRVGLDPLLTLMDIKNNEKNETSLITIEPNEIRDIYKVLEDQSSKIDKLSQQFEEFIQLQKKKKEGEE